MNISKFFPRGARRSAKLLRTLALLLVVVFTSQLFAVPVYADGGREITLLEFSGSCRVERGGDTLEAEEGMALFSGDVLVTDEDGSLRLRIDEDKFLYLGAASRVQIIAEGTAESSRTVVFVEAGSVMTEVNQKLSEGSSFDIVTPNTTTAIHGTKTLTEVIEDAVTGHVQTSNAVLEGQVKVKAVKVKADGTVVSVERDLGAGEGMAFKSAKEELVSQEEMQAIAETGASVSGIKVEIVSEEEAGVVFDIATFEATFLESVKNILIADAEAAAGEDGLSEEERDAIDAQTNEVMKAFEEIFEGSQNAINDATGTGNTPEPLPEPVSEPVAPQPVPEPVAPVEPGADDDQEDGTVIVDGDTNLVVIDDDEADGTDDGVVTDDEAGADEGDEAGADDEDEAGADEGDETGADEEDEAGADDEDEAGADDEDEAGADDEDEAGTDDEDEAGTDDEEDETGADEPENGGDEGGEAEGFCAELGHDWGEWTVVEPYADADGVWHAGSRIRVCERCEASDQETIYVTPVLSSELCEDAAMLPIDFFWIEGEQAPAEGLTLGDHEFPDWWVSSPLYNDDPETRVDIPGAEISWADKDILLSSLSVDDTLWIHIAIPEDYRDTFEDTDVEITLTDPAVMYEIF